MIRMNAKWCIVVVWILFLGLAWAENPLESSLGVIRDRKTAIKVAESILMSVYGRERVEREQPFIAELDDGNWYVYPKSNKRPIVFGGGFHITLSQKDARVIEIGYDE